jgi:hypothetical protein
MKTSIRLIIGGICCLLAACSGSDNNHAQENVFKEQIKAIDKAKAANKLMLDKAAEQRKEIDNIDQ